MDDRIEAALAIVLLLAALLIVNAAPTGFVSRKGAESEVSAVSFQEFGQCLTRNRVVLFVSGNAASQQQLSMLGEAASYMDIVDCDVFGSLCEGNGVSQEPAWDIFGERYVGVLQLGTLGDLAACQL